MKTVFVYANKLALAAFNDPQEELLKAFEGTALPHIAEHVVIFPLESKDEDLAEFHQQVADYAKEHGEADVFFYIVDGAELRIVQELLTLSSEIIFH
jgi:hypothetical protein